MGLAVTVVLFTNTDTTPVEEVALNTMVEVAPGGPAVWARGVEIREEMERVRNGWVSPSQRYVE